MTAIQKTPKERTNALMTEITTREATFQGLLPDGLKASWFLGEVRVAVARAPGLTDCTNLSIIDALTTCAQLGLSPSGRLGSAYLIPYKTKCTLVIGYRGYVDLAYRSGDVESFHAEVVHEKDTFIHEEGLQPVLKHIRTEEDNPGPLRAAYAVARMKGGGVAHVVMFRREVLAIKARGHSRTDSPWATDEAEMWKKTTVRRLIKLLPLSPTRAKDLYKAEAAERDQEEAFDVEFSTPAEDGPTKGVAGAKASLQAKVDRRRTLPPETVTDARAEMASLSEEPSPEEQAAILAQEMESARE